MKYFLLLWSISFLLFGWWLNVTSDNSITTMLVFMSGLVTLVGYIVLEKIDTLFDRLNTRLSLEKQTIERC